MKKKTERQIALEILTDITKNNAYNNIALKKAFENEDVEKSLITQIVNGTLRNIGHVDKAINSVSSTKTSKMNFVILTILRMSVFQLLFLEKVPAFAVCNEAVELTKIKNISGLSGFVNGVLRGIIKNMDSIKNSLAVEDCFPTWIVELFYEQYGVEFSKELMAAINSTPKIGICVNSLKTNRDDLYNALLAQGIKVQKTAHTNALTAEKISDITKCEQFIKGHFYIQDLSGLLTVDVLNPQPDEIIFDLCAAPGGKALYSAQKMNNTGKIFASDIHEHKMKLINQNAHRLGVKNIVSELRNAEICDASLKNTADRVLLDAPCSGLGLLQKKPDIRFKKKPDDIFVLSQIQKNMLKTAAEYLKPGGILVYSTCTFANAENIENVNWFLSNFDFKPESIQHVFPNATENFMQLFPNTDGTDGFFIAALRKG